MQLSGAERAGDEGWDFFISYTAADRGWAEWIAWQLEAAGYRVLIQAWDFVPGASWMAKMSDGVRGARYVLAVLSRSYLNSVYGRAEWEAAFREAPREVNKVIPVRVEDCPRPDLLAHVVSLDLFDLSADQARARLLESIQAVLTGRAKPLTEPLLPNALIPPVSAGSGGDPPSQAPGARERNQPRYPLASPHSDAPSEIDALDLAADVHTLASLMAAKGTSLPLSLALLGDWGSGKSTFMLQMQRQVEHLADSSRAARQESSFVSEVCQIDFNAWHYSDNQVWTGLVERIFRALATKQRAVAGQVEDADQTAADPKRLFADLESQRAREQELTEDLERISGRRSTEGHFSALTPVTKLADVARALVRETRRDLRASHRPLLVLLLVLIAGAGVWAAAGPKVMTTLSIVLAVVLPVGAAAVAFMGPVWHAFQRLAESADAQHKRLSTRRDDVRRQITELTEQLALVDATVALAAFLDNRAAASAYAGHRGLVSEVRDDLERLAEALAAAREEWTHRGQVGPPPLERIVLYIDDLDRCPPRRVVDVLAAIHLLLALPLFVVVVAVDTRWLIRSLRLHQHEMFAAQDQAATASLPADVVATPLDYLDKIFQIPFALRPMGDRAQQYLASLLPPEEGSEPDEGRRDEAEADRSAAIADGTHGSPQFPGASATTARQAEDVRPASLQISAAERDFLPLLHSFLPTPRVGKKFVNLYRLTRISVGPDDLPDFLGASENGGPYQAVMILLAVLVGRASQAHALFQVLREGDSEEKLQDYLRTEPGQKGFAESWTNLTGLRLEVASTIDELSSDTPVLTRLGEYQRWSVRIARFSFTGGELGG